MERRVHDRKHSDGRRRRSTADPVAGASKAQGPPRLGGPCSYRDVNPTVPRLAAATRATGARSGSASGASPGSRTGSGARTEARAQAGPETRTAARVPARRTTGRSTGRTTGRTGWLIARALRVRLAGGGTHEGGFLLRKEFARDAARDEDRKRQNCQSFPHSCLPAEFCHCGSAHARNRLAVRAPRRRVGGPAAHRRPELPDRLAPGRSGCRHPVNQTLARSRAGGEGQENGHSAPDRPRDRRAGDAIVAPS